MTTQTVVTDVVTYDVTYDQVLQVVRHWSPAQRLSLLHDVLRTLTSKAETTPQPARDTLAAALGLIATPDRTPTDEQVKRWLEEDRIEKYN